MGSGVALYFRGVKVLGPVACWRVTCRRVRV